MGAMKLSPVRPAHSRSAEGARLSSAHHAQGPQALVTGTFDEYPSVAGSQASARLRLARYPGLPQLLLLPRLAPVDALQTSPRHPLTSLHHLRPGRLQEPPQLLRHLRLALGGAAGALRS